jgi:hypothetical protein
VIARHVAETVPKLEHEHARLQSMLEAKIDQLNRSLKVSRERLHAFRKIAASSRTREETF